MMIRKEKEIGKALRKTVSGRFYPNNDDIPKDEYRPSKQIRYDGEYVRGVKFTITP